MILHIDILCILLDTYLGNIFTTLDTFLKFDFWGAWWLSR